MGDEQRTVHAKSATSTETAYTASAAPDALEAPTHRRPARDVTAATPGLGKRSAPTTSGADPTASALRARFWGVRGSYPLATMEGSRIGGATTCLELRHGRRIVIVDAGSGVIALGEALAREWRDQPPAERPAITLLFTHAHHDHLCGLPFFAPLFDSHARITLLGPDLAGMRFSDIIAGYMRSPYFPVDFHQLPSQRTLISIGDGARLSWEGAAHTPHVQQAQLSAGVAATRHAKPSADDATTRLPRAHSAPAADALVVNAMHSNLHPREGTLVYRASVGGRSLVFATDVEVGAHGPEADARFIQFAKGADLLIHDAQYSEEDYHGDRPDDADVALDATAWPARPGRPAHRGFGHSTPMMAAQVAQRAGVGRLALTHHNPAYDDATVESLVDAARRHFPNVITAREGMELTIGEA